ncbi:hypothetical protein VCHC59B1_3390B, partial [Vibrio cholerae HC-59B1]
CVNALSAP